MGAGPWVRMAVGLLAVGVCAAGVPRARDPGRRRTFYSDDDDDGDDGGIGGGIGSIVDEELNYNVQRINEEKTRHGQGGNFGDDFGLPKKGGVGGGGGGGIFGGDDDDEDDDDDDDEGDDDGKGGGGKGGGGGGRRRLNEPNRPVVATNYGKLRGIRVSLPSPDAVLRSDGRGAEGPGAGPAGTPGGGGPSGGGGGPLVVTQFLGVPYARAPRGERRFSAAEPPAVWSGEREAATRGPPCPQPVPNHRGPDWAGWGMLPVWEAGNERLATWLSSKQSEECLNLDVYIPGRDVPGERPPLAVMVFLHGGSFLDGAGGLYDGSALAAHGDVIVVIVTYRLGVLGFFSTGDSLARGNYGLLDQVMALRWVRENVGHFGGDQGRVTLVGAGTGAACASLLALSHHAEGLFQRVIAQSGTALSSWALNHRPELSAAALARSVGCLRPLPPPPRHRSSAPHRQQQQQQRQRDVTVVGPAAMACLRRKSTEELVEASASLSEFSLSSSSSPPSSSSSPPPLSPFSFSPSHFRSVFAPTVDGEVIPDDPRALLEQGEFLNYNTMLGVAQAEGLRLAEAFLEPDERPAFSLGLGGGGGFGGGAEMQGGLDGRSAAVAKPGAKVAAVESRRPALPGAPPAIPGAAPAVPGPYEDRNPAGGGAFSAAFSRAVDELVDGLYAAEVVGDGGDDDDDDDDSDDQDSESPGTEALRETVRFMYTDWADRDNAEMRRKTLLALLTDHQWVAPAVATADLRSQFGSPTYFYALYQRCDGEPTPSVGAGGSTSGGSTSSGGTTGVKDRGGGDSVASKTLTAASAPSTRAGGAVLAPPAPAGGGGAAASSAAARPAWADAAHGDELPYVLGAPFLRPSSRFSRMFACNFSRGDAALSATVIAYWSNFAKSGDPNRPEITDDDDDDIDGGGGGAGGEDGVDGGARSSVFVEVPWRRYSPREQHYLHLGPRPRLREHYRANKVAFWLELVPHLQYMASSSSTSYKGRHFTGFGATRRPPGAIGRRGPSGTGHGTTRRPKGPDRASRKDKGSVDAPGGGGGSTRRQEGGTGGGIEGGNEAGRDGDASQRRDYSTELSVTIAVGTSMLLLNVLAFAALCYKREKRRREEAGLYPCRHGHQRGGSLASSVSSVGSHRTQQHNHHGGGSNLHRHHRQPQHQQQMMVDPHHQHLHRHQSEPNLGDDQHHLQEQQQHRRALWGDSDDEGVLPSPLDVEGSGGGGLCVGGYSASACRVLIHDDDDVIVDNGGVADNNEEDDYEEYEYDEEFRNGAGATSSLLFHHHHHNNNQQQQHQPQQQQRQPRRKAAAMMRKRRSLTTTTTMTPQSVVDYFPDEVAVVAVPDTFECPRDYALTLRRSPEDLPLTLGLGLGLGLGLNHQGGHGHHHLHHHQGLAPHAANVAQGPGGLAQQGQQGQQGLQYQHGPVGQALPGGFGEQHKVRHC
ncbi:unnamed protein product [Lampetra planeri]